MADGDSDSDSDATIILDELGQEEEELDTSDENKENVAPRTPSPDNVDAVTPVSPPASTTEPTPSPPPENFPPFDYWGTAIGDFEVAKATANIEPTKEVPTKMYLDLVLSLLAICIEVTMLSLPLKWRALICNKVEGGY